MMSRFGTRLINCLRTNKVGLSLFGVLALGTVGFVMSPVAVSGLGLTGGGNIKPSPTVSGPTVYGPKVHDSKVHDSKVKGTYTQGVNAKGVSLTGKLSQTKLIQGESGEVYVTVSIKSPSVGDYTLSDSRGTDLVVVLDRSGSMSTPEKLPYAKSAVKQLLTKLSETDRFALVSFEDKATIDIPLSTIAPHSTYRIEQVIDSVSAGGGTNIHLAVTTAWQILKQSPSARTRKVILLSDGEATAGDTSVYGLKQVAALANQSEAMLSTIGMGLGFNEKVMSSMADHGMGSFSYLESLEQLGSILSTDFEDAKQTFAANSHLRIQLEPGMQLVDAGGYPIEPAHSSNADGNGSNVVDITTGRLLSNTTKSFILTVRVPKNRVAEYDLSDMQLMYNVNGQAFTVDLPDSSLQLAVIEPQRKPEAIASIDQKVFADVWQENNIGRMRYDVNDYLRKGDKANAEAVVKNYRQKLKTIEKESGVKVYEAVADELDGMQSALEEAFVGSASEQKMKQNRLAKKSHAESIGNQRKVVK